MDVTDIDHRNIAINRSDGFADGGIKFGIGDQQFAITIFQNIGNGLRLKPRIDCIQHTARHRHTKMRFKHFWGV